jgi:hypothetical protein
MARARFRRSLVFVSMAALAASSSTAQINEADRLQRCANNRATVLRIDEQLRTGPLWNDEQVARGRQALVAMRREYRDHLGMAVSYYNVFDKESRALADASLERFLAAARAANLMCVQPDRFKCPGRMIERLERQIDESVAALPARRVIECERMAAYNRYMALGCDNAGATDPLGTRWSESESGWTGDWVRRGTSNTFDAVWRNGGMEVRAVLTVNVSGNTVSVQRVNASDSNSCVYQGTVNGNAVSGTYSCTAGGGSWSATIR